MCVCAENDVPLRPCFHSNVKIGGSEMQPIDGRGKTSQEEILCTRNKHSCGN